MTKAADALIASRRKEAARRALAEASERKRQRAEAAPLPKEVGNRKGLEPTRYGDWEKKGIASDF
jgi:hypothetical protein